MEAHDCNFRDDLGMGCISSRCPGHRAMRILGENLRVASMLCRAFHLGRAWQYERLASEWNGGGWTYPFEPGCGRSAP